MAADLNAESVNELLRSLVDNGASPHTAKNRRSGLLVLMRFAKREGIIAADPDRVRRIHCPRLEPKGYTMADMARLVSFAAKLRGVVRRSGVSKRLYWTSMVLTMWNVGCRISDILRAEVCKFDSANGRLWLHEGKTGKARWHRLHGATASAISASIAANPKRKHIWPGYNSKNIVRAFTRLADAAGVGGTSRYIRRGSSSALDRLQPGQGWRFLNHSDPRVFEQHYRDAEICEDEMLAPPELPCGEEILQLCAPKPSGRRMSKPKPEKPAKLVYERACDVPLTKEVREALRQHPMDDSHLAVLVGHLAAHGIPQRKLAEWWGVAFKRYQDLRYGYRPITLAVADRLRSAFELPTQGIVAGGRILLGSLVATPEIWAILNAQCFGARELDTVLRFCKQMLGISQVRLAHDLGICAGYLYKMRAGKKTVQLIVQQQLRDLFEPPAALQSA